MPCCSPRPCLPARLLRRRGAVVTILDITAQFQAQVALSDLAEAQLALLAGLMPHHAVQVGMIFCHSFACFVSLWCTGSLPIVP